MRSLIFASALVLSGCAGVPIGHHSYVFVGVGFVHVDRVDQAIGISSQSIGLTAGCNNLTLGVQASYCAQLPLGDVAIIEKASGPRQRLSIFHLHQPEQAPK